MATRDRTPQTGQPSPAPHHGRQRKRPDAFARLMHAVLALAFLGAWLTAEWEGLRTWHIAFGHAMAGALLLRIAGSLARPRASLGRWWRAMTGAARRWHAGRERHAERVVPLRAATWSVAGRAAVVCGILVLVPGCFLSGWALSRLLDAPVGPVNLHRWLGTALMLLAAAHVALIAVLSLLRERCMACDMLPWGGDRPADSGKDRR